jgi:hypothetical protein
VEQAQGTAELADHSVGNGALEIDLVIGGEDENLIQLGKG